LRGVQAVAFLGAVCFTVAAERRAATNVDVPGSGVIGTREAAEANRIAISGLSVPDQAERRAAHGVFVAILIIGPAVQ
jgi:hypothetical protein